MLKRRRRSSRANGLLSLSEVGHVGECRRQAIFLGAPQAGADGKLDGAEALGEGELLLVGEVLIVEDEDPVLVHAGVNFGDDLFRQGPRQVDAVNLAGEARANLSDGQGHDRELHCGRPRVAPGDRRCQGPCRRRLALPLRFAQR